MRRSIFLKRGARLSRAGHGRAGQGRAGLCSGYAGPLLARIGSQIISEIKLKSTVVLKRFTM
jgi:hypothetical protein